MPIIKDFAKKVSSFFQKRTILLYLFLCFFLSKATAQSPIIDSLLLLLPQLGEESQRVDVLNALSWEFHRMEMSKTLTYGEEAFALAERLGYEKGLGRAANLIAIRFATIGENDKAIELNKKCLEIGERLQDQNLIAMATNDMGVSYSEQGKKKEALLYLHRSLDIVKNNKNIDMPTVAFSNLASLHQAIGNIEEARKYLLEAIAVGEESKDGLTLSYAYIDLASFYMEEKKWDEAAASYKKALEISTKENDKRIMSIVYLDLGLIAFEKGNRKQAVENGERSIRIIKELGDALYEMKQCHKIATLYRKLGQLEKAIACAERSLLLANENGLLKSEVEVYETLAALYAEINEYEKAFEYNEDYLTLKDSLFNREKVKDIAELEEKYQSQQKAMENELLKTEQKEQAAVIKEQRTWSYLLCVIILLTGFLGFVSYKAYLSKIESHKLLENEVAERTMELQKSNTELLDSNIELERFAYVASHDLKEPLRNITSFTGLLERELDLDEKSNAQEFMTYIIKNTKQMHQLIEGVLDYSQMSSSNNSLEFVDLNICINGIQESLANTIKSRNVSVVIPNKLPIVKAEYPKMFFLFKNLIENGIKYNESENIVVEIHYELKSKHHSFVVADNGIGIKGEYFQQIFEMFKRLHNRNVYEGTGLGLALCKKIVTELGGTIWIESKEGDGSEFYFTLPKRKELVP